MAFGKHWLIGAPRAFDGRGAVFDESGRVLLEGDEGENLGGKPTVHGAGFAVLKRGGVVSTLGDDWTVGRRLWQLCSGDFDGDGKPALVAGVAGGGLSVGGVDIASPNEMGDFGYALAACDLDGDGDDDLVVGAPGRGKVYLYLTDDLQELLSAKRVLEVGHRGGEALACWSGQLAVGAPGGAGRVWWFDDPLDGEAELVVEGDDSLAAMGSALGVREDNGALTMAVGAPGAGRVLLLSQVR
ncbi:MAG: hypothetical protein HN348_00740 [Proteobacteria bacterium]|nr:hypothetical protein [Pseudomonadota bacterium]